VAVGGIALILLMQKFGVRAVWAYVPPALIIWGGAYATGVHPTLAGVVVGLLTPVRSWLGPQDFVFEATAAVAAVNQPDSADDDRPLLSKMSELDLARREAVSPVERLQHALHGWVAFVIMPLFALANAGVPLGAVRLEGEGQAVLLGVALGLVLGKPLGVLGLSWVAVRLGLATLPGGVRWMEVLIVGVVAGIGFTMALFIASLAFPPGPLAEVAKLGILCASAVAAVAGLLLGRFLLSPTAPPRAARTAAEAEASTRA